MPDDGVDYLFTRYDRDAYIAARGGGTSADRFDEHHEDDSSSEHRLQQRRDSASNNERDYDDPNRCTTYLAPSSIPNSGLGMYTSVPYRKEEIFPFPEVGVFIAEMKRHYRSEKVKLLAQYPWASTMVTFGKHDAGYGEALVSGLGMLANSHLGLHNMRHSEVWRVQRWMDGTDSLFGTDSLTIDDAGRGSHSWHGNVLFDASKNIQAGEELFVSYGDEWFVARSDMLGHVPGQSHYKEADESLSRFLAENKQNAQNYAYVNAEYDKVLKEAQEKDMRLRMAFPNNLNEVAAAVEMGTARYSAKHSVQTVEWLEENGVCIDNIVSGQSTIPQAGRGAFATRSIRAGERVTSTPLVTLERDELLLWETAMQSEEGEVVQELKGFQCK